MPYFVSRQSYWPDGELVVEIAQGGRDYANPDMLVAKWPELGEGQEYDDPREAVEAAIKIKKAWQAITDEPVSVAYGHTLGMTMPFEASEDRKAREWARHEYARLPKCDRCGELLGEDFWTTEETFDDRFCSEYCAGETYREAMADWYGEYGWDETHVDTDGCCECGSVEHTCQDCPTFLD